MALQHLLLLPGMLFSQIFVWFLFLPPSGISSDVPFSGSLPLNTSDKRRWQLVCVEWETAEEF